MPGGRVELPTNPESFRGCSTVADDKALVADFSSVSALALFAVHLGVSILPFSPQFRASFRGALLLLCDRGDAERIARGDLHKSQYNAGHLSHEECKPQAILVIVPGGRVELPTKGL